MFPIDPWLIIILAIALVSFLVLTIILGVRAHQRKISAGREELIGMTAEAVTAIEPKGTVLVQGERWAAILDKGRAEPGEEVTITKVEGLKLRVTKKNKGGTG